MDSRWWGRCTACPSCGRFPSTRSCWSTTGWWPAGIKDLRYGACVEEDWRDHESDEVLRDRCTDVPFLATAAYRFVATTAAPAAVGLLVGDHLVRPSSASGTGKYRRIPFEPQHGLTLAEMHHFDLLNHPHVYTKLHEWVSKPAQRAPHP